MENSDLNNDNRKRKPPTILAGYLASALNMEDEISNGVYSDYLKPENWPEQINPEIFQKIRDRLIILIEDTRKHKKIIAALTKDPAQSR